MKKTVSINISGVIFNIDEDAYEKLQNYLKAIRGFFSESEGCDEIMADIEARIAEMFSEKTAGRQEVVTLVDVEEVIGIMGQPEEYIDQDSEESNAGKSEEEAASGSRRTKRIYRDKDGEMLGGVCSGLGYYFGFDPIWLRIAFVLTLFFFGGGVFLYVVLWIVIPAAKTTADKFEMKGKNVTASSIGKKVEEEMKGIKDKLKDLDGKPHIEKAKSILGRIIDTFVAIVLFVFRAFGRLIGFAFLVAGIALAVVFIVSMFSGEAFISITSEGISNFSVYDFSNMFFASADQEFLAFVGLLLLIGIPIISLMYGGIKLLFKLKHTWIGVGIGLTALWIAGWIACGVVALQLSGDFAKKANVVTSIDLEQPQADTLFLSTSKDRFKTDKHHWGHSHDDLLIDFDEDNVYIGHAELDIVESNNDSIISVEIIKYSRGESKKDAMIRAADVAYHYSQNDSSLSFSPYYSFPKENSWRVQRVKVIVYLPVGKSVHLGKDMDRIIYDVKNVTHTHDRKMPGKTWTMLEDGLTCVGCNEDEI